MAHGITLDWWRKWRVEHPDFPSYGYVVRRRDLDEMVARPGWLKAGRHALAAQRGRRAAGGGRAW